MKKNLILAIAGVLAVQISMAQTQKGAQTLGGYLYFMKTSGENTSLYNNQPNIQKTNATYFNIGPTYSVFLADNLELGGSLLFSTQTNKMNYSGLYPGSDFKQVSDTFGASLLLLKYFMHNNFGVRVGPYVGYSGGKTKITDSNQPAINNTRSDIYNAGAKLDLVYYPSKKLGLAASLANLGYSKLKSHNVDDAFQKSSTESFNVNIITNGVGLSVFYVFGNK